MMISVTIIVKNGERRLSQVLNALTGFDDIVLYDTGSSDSTLEIAKQFSNVSIYQKPFIGFGAAHNDAATLAKHKWVLSIDADEILSNELAEEILSTPLNTNCVYALPFHNYFNGKRIKWCGWYPETHIRLYHKKNTSFSEALVHEGVLKKDLSVKTFQNPVNHYPYETVGDFLTKMERYSSLFAAQYQHKRNSSPLIAILHGSAAFFKSYFIKKGFLGGFEGFLISIYNGHTAFYKYIKLYQANKE